LDAVSLPNRSTPRDWPALQYEAWSETLATLHMWTQVVGKIRLVCTPWTNHSWHVPLYVTARGLSTSPIARGGAVFEMEFDFLQHALVIRTAEGRRHTVRLEQRPVADFYEAVVNGLRTLGLNVRIHTTPSEIPGGIPFERDTTHRSYDPDYAYRFWCVLIQTDRVFKEFRARFIGKCSPVHFFWGSFDLAVTRFSGRPAPPHPGGVPNFPDWAAREAYSHEVSSAGFWPGGRGAEKALFYSYAYPAPKGYELSEVRPDGAFWSEELGEFMLPYESVRTASSPDDALLDFLQSTYEAAADLGGWDREALERSLPPRRG